MTKTFEALASGDALELRIYGPIGATMFADGVSAEMVAGAIKAAGAINTIVVRMSCPGGNAYDGMAIRSLLAAHPATKVCEVEGLAASAGSIVAMGCDTIRMHTGSALMIHEASAAGIGRSRVEDLRKAISALDTLNDGMAQIYAERTGLSKDKCRKLMAAETWLTPEQAKAQGFCDELVAGKSKMAAAFDLSAFGYQHVPAFIAGGDDETVPIPPPAPATESGEEAEEDPKQSDSGGGEDEEEEEDEPAEGDAVTVEPLTKEDLREAMEGLLTRSNSVPQQTAAGRTAEASAARTRLDTMTIKLIAQAAGLSADADESAIVTTVSRLQAFVTELKTLTKSDSCEATLGAIRGLQAAAEQVGALNAKLAEQSKQLEAQDRAALLAADKADPAGRKLTPAMETFWSERPVAELKAFLAVAPNIPALKMEQGKSSSQPAAKTSAAADGGAPIALTHNGKTFEQMTGLELAALYAQDLDLYRRMKANSVERGASRAQSQQQRTSA